MGHPRFKKGQISKLGEESYERIIRTKVENEANIGRMISIEVETEESEIDDDVFTSALRVLAKNPGAALYCKRIGCNSVYSVGGTVRWIVP